MASDGISGSSVGAFVAACLWSGGVVAAFWARTNSIERAASIANDELRRWVEEKYMTREMGLQRTQEITNTMSRLETCITRMENDQRQQTNLLQRIEEWLRIPPRDDNRRPH